MEEEHLAGELAASQMDAWANASGGVPPTVNVNIVNDSSCGSRTDRENKEEEASQQTRPSRKSQRSTHIGSKKDGKR